MNKKKKEVKLYRNCQIIFRVTLKEKQLLEKIANNNKLNLSSYMRQVLFINNKKDTMIDNSTIEQWRKINMNKNNLNKVIKKGAIIIAASLATMSLFGCNSKVEENKTYTTYPIDQDEQISNGDKIITKVEETKVPETKVEETKIEETTAAGSLNVGSIDFNTVEIYNNEAEISEQLKANRNKRKTGNSYGYTKEYIKNMKIPDYLLDNTGNDDRDIRCALEDYDYLWEYMEDPENFKVDYSLSDKDFIRKYGAMKTDHIAGLPYEFGSDGYPTKNANEKVEIVNPNNGKRYIWDVGHNEWWDKENPPELYVPSDEELKDIAAAYSASFK